MTFTDEFTFTSMQLVSIFYMMLRFVGSLMNTHDDNDELMTGCVRMVCASCKQRVAAADGPISWMPGGVVQLCCPPVLRRLENQRMLSSFNLSNVAISGRCNLE